MAKQASSKAGAAKGKTDKGALEGFENVGAPRKAGQPPMKVAGKSGYARLIGNKKPGEKG
jgi:hypothetical protein